MPSRPPNIGTSLLRTLHRIHRQLTDLKERLDRCPKQIRATEANVQHRESLLAQAKADAKALRMAADQQQLQLKSSEDKVKDLRRKLNAASSNREYQVLWEQVAADEMTNSVLADEILEALEKVDAFQKDIAEAEAASAAARQRAAEVRAQVAQQEPLLTADITRLEAELQQTEATLPAEIRESYRRVVRQRGEDALAVVENQCCGGCNQQVPLNVCGQIIMGQPVFCRTCGRLLYMPENPEHGSIIGSPEDRKSWSWEERARRVKTRLEKGESGPPPFPPEQTLPFLDDLCVRGRAIPTELVATYNWNFVNTTLDNITMAIQGYGGGDVWPPEEGGWYKSIPRNHPECYEVTAEFAAAWLALRGLAKKSVVVEE